MILAGDVGGTKVDLALCKFDRGQLVTVHEGKFARQGVFRAGAGGGRIPGREQAVAGEPSDVLAACFGVPGPVRHGRLKLTNLPWELDAGQLAVDLKIEHVYLINDLEANGYGIAELTPEQILVLEQGRPGCEGKSRR